MKRLLVILLVPLLATACCMIDDDLSVCGVDMVIDYKLQLYTELSVQLQTELVTEAEKPVRDALEKWLAPIFTDKAKDVDLRFFTEQTDEIEHQIQEEINDNKSSYTIYLPKENYTHLAVANFNDNGQLRLFGEEHSTTMELRQIETGDIPCSKTGIFTARLPMHVSDSTTNFEVHLYMVSCAVALVIDPSQCPDLVSVFGSVQGTADRFMVRDSIFIYDDRAPRIIMENLDIAKSNTSARKLRAEEDNSTRLCLATVGMPSEDENQWSIRVVSTLTNNRHTTTALTVETPLKAGTLRIFKCQMGKNGELVPDTGDADSQDLGATVELDWNDGGDFDIEI